MTEKRFECDKGSRIIIDNETKLHYIMTLDWECRLVTKLLNRFAEENEQLRQRNNNQYNQLTELWQIIEEENWEKLIAMKKQLKEDEERLQKEWKHYK